MPLIRSAIKKAKQDVLRTNRNRHFKTRMQTMYKNIKKFVEVWETEKAKWFISEAYSAIDTAAKKNIIHKNNAANKKSKLAKMVWATPATTKKEAKKASAKKPTVKKTATKKAPAKKSTTKKTEEK